MTQDKRRQRGFSRRKFMQGAAAGAAAAASGTMLGGAAHAHGKKKTPNLDPDVILQNGRIHTMDEHGTVASTVAIKDGRFMQIERGRSHIQAGRKTRVIDLRGRTVVPGIIDNHNHLVLMGNRPGYHTPLENAHSIAEALAIYAARSKEIPAGAWITTIGGFHSNHLYENPADKLTGRFPTQAELDKAVPNHPVFMAISFTGPGATNSAGRSILEANGVVVGANGSIATGFPSSECTKALLFLRQTLLTPAERRRGVLDAMKYAASLGVTTHIDQGAFQAVNNATDGAAHEDNFTMQIPFLEVYEQREELLRKEKALVRLRINFLHMETDDATPELIQRLKNAFPFFGDDWVKTGGIGEFIAQGTAVPGRFLEAARRVAKAGWRAEVHSLGRRQTPTSPPPDFELEIDAFETVNKEFPGVVGDKRWVIAHVPGITQESIARFKSFGGSLSLTGWQFLAGTIPAVSVTPFAGPPFRWIVDSGIRAGMSSDGMQIAPMNPWIHMYFATTGINARGVLINPGQQITRQEVLGLYTRDNGWFVREEDQLGTIEKGKLADLVVLDRDYFSVPQEDLKRIRSLLTIVGGEIVHDAKVLRVEREDDDDDDDD
ncbi:MAG TPA: amidohydrolase family protein [Burkholderiales bacterium]|nr:amidohydrolase family protein [Burkholderiales bacterium]